MYGAPLSLLSLPNIRLGLPVTNTLPYLYEATTFKKCFITFKVYLIFVLLTRLSTKFESFL